MPIVFLDGMEDSTSMWQAGSASFAPARNGKGLWMQRDGYVYYYNIAPPSTTTMTVGFAYRPIEFVVATNVIAAIGGYGVYNQSNLTHEPQVYLTQGVDGSISVRVEGNAGAILGTTAPGTVALGAWSFLEVQAKCHVSAGTCIIRVNNQQRLSLSGIRTNRDTYTAPAYTDLFLGDIGDCNEMFIDDLYVMAGDGELFLGDLVVETLYPNGNGAVNEWRGSDGNSTDNYLLVDEPSIDSANVRISIHNQRDLYQLSNLATLAGGVLGVDHHAHSSRDSETPAMLGLISRGSSDTISAPIGVSTSTNDVVVHYALAKNPETGLNWTVSEVNALQSGVVYVDPTVVDPTAGEIILLESFTNFSVPSPAGAMAVTVGESYNPATLDKPSGITAGDLLIMFAITDSATVPVFSPAAWTQIGVASPSAATRFYCFARLATAGTAAESWQISGAAQDFALGVQRVVMHGVTDVSTLTPTFTTLGFSQIDPPSVTLPVRQTMLWYAAGGHDNSLATETITAVSTGYTIDANQISSATATSVSLGVSHRTAAVLTENPSTWGGTSRPWAATTLPIPPVTTAWTTAWTAEGVVSTVPGRTGNAVEISGVGNHLTYRIPPAKESKDIVVGCAFRATVDTNNVRTVLELRSDSDLIYGQPDVAVYSAVSHLVLAYSGATGRFFIHHGSTSGAVLSNSAIGLLPFNTWGYIEIAATLGNSNGRFEVRLNGTRIMLSSYGDTRNDGQKDKFDTVRLTTNSAADTGQWDDLYVRVNGNTFRGDIPIP